MPIIGTIASSTRQGLSTTAFDSISSTTIGSGGAASVTFSNIPSTYQHLQLRITARGTAAGANINGTFYFNNDQTLANYRTQEMYFDGAGSVNDYRSDAAYLQRFPTATNNGTWASIILDIYDYKDTNKFKSMLYAGGFSFTGPSGVVCNASVVWENTNAITSMQIDIGTGNFAEHSRFALYGIRS